MKKREEILAILSKRKPEWSRRYKLKKIALFGSYARQEQNEQSDVDIWVEVDPSIGLEFVSLAEAIEAAVGLKVEVVSSRAINPRNWQYIETELIYV